MTLKNTILLAGILMAAVSCSMEDDLIPSKDNDKVDGDGNNYAFISARVNDLNTTTKAGGDSELQEETQPDNTATHASLILFNNDSDTNPTVFMVWDGLIINTDGELLWNDSPTFQLKLADDIESLTLKAKAVANTTQSFAGCNDLAEVEAIVQDGDDLAALVKVSPLSAAFDVLISPTLADADVTEIPSLTVTNIAAQIRFIGMEAVSFATNTLATDVVVNSVSINHINSASYTKVNDMTVADIDPDFVAASQTDFKVWDKDDGKVTDAAIPTFRTFVNNDGEDPIYMKLTLTYGEGTYNVPEFIINRPSEPDGFTNGSGHTYIQSGAIYNVQLNAQLKGKLLDCTVICYTRDWIYEPYTFELMPVEPDLPVE